MAKRRLNAANPLMQSLESQNNDDNYLSESLSAQGSSAEPSMQQEKLSPLALPNHEPWFGIAQ